MTKLSNSRTETVTFLKQNTIIDLGVGVVFGAYCFYGVQAAR